MKKAGEIGASLITIGACLYGIWKIEYFSLRLYGITFLIIAFLSLALDSQFESLKSRIKKQTAKSDFSKVVLLTRVIPVVLILVLIFIPRTYNKIPGWVKSESIRILNSEISDDDKLKLSIGYIETFPKKKENLIVFLRDSVDAKKSTVELSISASEAGVFMTKLIGTPKGWLDVVAFLFIFTCIILFALMFLYRSLGT